MLDDENRFTSFFYYHLRNFKKHGFEKRPFKVCGQEKKNLLKGDIQSASLPQF